MQVLNGAVFAKHVLQVLLGGLLVDVGDDDDPAFDGADGSRAGGGGRVAGFGGGRGALGLVNVHLGVGHDCGVCVGVRVGMVGRGWCCAASAGRSRLLEKLSPISQFG